MGLGYTGLHIFKQANWTGSVYHAQVWDYCRITHEQHAPSPHLFWCVLPFPQEMGAHIGLDGGILPFPQEMGAQMGLFSCVLPLPQEMGAHMGLGPGFSASVCKLCRVCVIGHQPPTSACMACYCPNSRGRSRWSFGTSPAT